MEKVSGKVTTINGDAIKKTFLVGLLEDVLFDGVLADETVDVDLTRLADSVATVLGLSIHRRVPITVVKDDCVCTCEVDAKTTTARREDKDKDAWVHVETVHLHLSHLRTRRSVETQVGVAVEIQEDLEDVEDLGHLSENQNAMTSLLQTLQEEVELLQLSTVVLDELLGWEGYLHSVGGIVQDSRRGSLDDLAVEAAGDDLHLIAERRRMMRAVRLD